MRLPQCVLSAAGNLTLRAPSVCRSTLRPVLHLMGLKLTAKLLHYASDFEIAYKTDMWNEVAGHFTSDAVYEVRNTDFSCRIEGRNAIVAGFKKSLDGFDRHLKRTMHVVDGPSEDGDKLSFVWFGRYSHAGVPPLELSARQTLLFNDDKIKLLVDEFLPTYGENARTWIESHRPDLNPAYV